MITFESERDTWTREAADAPARGDKVRLGYERYIVRDIIWEFGFDRVVSEQDEVELTIYVETDE